MTDAESMAGFVDGTSYSSLPDDVRDEVKKRILDSIGIGIGALGTRPTDIVRETVLEISGNDRCVLWGSDSKASPPQAAMYNTALVRYLDYMDSFLAPEETPHPSDNIASAIVCGEYEERSGEELITSVGIAYEIQAALAWNAPVRNRGWDHVTHTVISSTACSSRMLGLDAGEIKNALSIAGTAHNTLRVTRTGKISMWKGIASANAARNAVYSSLLARNGMEGPTDLFDGEKGWKHIISGDFEAEYDPGCSSVKRTMTKKYVAETYAQSAVEAALELVESEDIRPEEIEGIHLDTFAGAKQIIGGGEGGDRHEVETREQADHSLPYMIAAAILDGKLLNEQYGEERIKKDDVQELLRKVEVEEDSELTERFEEGEMPARLSIETGSGSFEVEKNEFEGHPRNPASWDMVERKFHMMSGEKYDEERRNDIVDVITNLEDFGVKDLTSLLD